jgi:hypothetical protein
MKASIFILAITLLQFLTGCFSTWTPSDEEAVKLLKNYYSFYEEEGVEASIIKRGTIIDDCSCFPIEFQIMNSEKGTYTKTFYFFKNGDGVPEIKKFKFGVKYSSS